MTGGTDFSNYAVIYTCNILYLRYEMCKKEENEWDKMRGKKGKIIFNKMQERNWNKAAATELTHFNVISTHLGPFYA